MSDVAKGDRVRWSEYGEKHAPPGMKGAKGTCVGRSSENLVTIQWDGQRNANSVHCNFIELDDVREPERAGADDAE